MPEDGGGRSPAEALELADWRRRVSELYAAVRDLAPRDHGAALELWRRTRERLYREHPQSPLPPAGRADFRALHYDADPAMRFELPVVADDAGTGSRAASRPAPGATTGAAPSSFGSLAIAYEPQTPVKLPVSAGGTMSFSRIGHVDIPFPAGSRRLGVFWMAGYAGGLFVPFRDATNGSETYGAGRYVIDTAKSADLGGDLDRGTLVLDFNFAFHPSCAFDAAWACPLAPPENRLDIPIRAGERLA